MGKQENVSDFYQFAKDLAKAEKELKIENWVQISICYGYGHHLHFRHLERIPLGIKQKREPAHTIRSQLPHTIMMQIY